jgi:predicted branched-subunit amino acid permease
VRSEPEPAAGGAGGQGEQHPAGLRTADLVALLLASITIGVAVTSIMVEVGTSGFVVMAACILSFSGTGELAYASVIASGGGLAPALIASLLVSSRFGLLAMSMTGRWPASLWERVGIAHFASEPAVGAALEAADRGPAAARKAFWQLAIWMSVGWVVGSALGLALGNVVGDPRRIGLDAVFPASFIGAVIIAFRRLDATTAVVLGGATAVLLTPLLPAGVPVLLASFAAVAAMAVPSRPLSLRLGRGRRRSEIGA